MTVSRRLWVSALTLLSVVVGVTSIVPSQAGALSAEPRDTAQVQPVVERLNPVTESTFRVRKASGETLGYVNGDKVTVYRDPDAPYRAEFKAGPYFGGFSTAATIHDQPLTEGQPAYGGGGVDDRRDVNQFCNPAAGENASVDVTVYEAKYVAGELSAVRLGFKMKCVAAEDPDDTTPYTWTGRLTWHAKPVDGPSSIDLKAPASVKAGKVFTVKAQTTWSIGQQVTFYRVDYRGRSTEVGRRQVKPSGVARIRLSLDRSYRLVARVNGARSTPVRVRVQ